MASTIISLPSVAPFPVSAWKDHLVPDEWEASLDAWITLASAHLSFSVQDFLRISAKDESLTTFLASYSAGVASSPEKYLSNDVFKSKLLRKQCYLLCYRLLDLKSAPTQLLLWEILSDLSKIYGQKQGGHLVGMVWKRHGSVLESTIGGLKSSLTKELDAGLKGDLQSAETQLKRLSHLIHASPEAAAFLVAGSDFLDSLIGCYKIMNPPLRKVIISTVYLCLIGLTEGERPQLSTLIDQLYSLQVAADAHKAGPLNVNDSLVAELVTATPILKQVQERVVSAGSTLSRAKPVLHALGEFKKSGGGGRPQRLIKRKVNKGKGRAFDNDGTPGEVHVHRMSLISQVQDLFPDLGSGFIVRLLDEYEDQVEEVISHLLEGSLPPRLESADRSESLTLPGDKSSTFVIAFESGSPPEQLQARRNVFDDDEFDRLAVDTSRIHFGRRNPNRTADDVLQDRSDAPNKAAILSALATFDSDDDERDDTYDIEDVGGTVDSAAPGNNLEEANAESRDIHDEALFKAYKSTPGVFGRDTTTRRSAPRASLKLETGMTDEAIEGWGLMLSRDFRQMKRLEAQYSSFRGDQLELAPTAWRASPAGSGAEDSDLDGNHRGRGGFRGRGGRGRGGRGRGNVAGPSGAKDTDAARHRKEANKGSTANHNRRDQRARKMARAGFPG